MLQSIYHYFPYQCLRSDLGPPFIDGWLFSVVEGGLATQREKQTTAGCIVARHEN